jgi:hypothetical protein
MPINTNVEININVDFTQRTRIDPHGPELGLTVVSGLRGF